MYKALRLVSVSCQALHAHSALAAAVRKNCRAASQYCPLVMHFAAASAQPQLPSHLAALHRRLRSNVLVHSARCVLAAPVRRMAIVDSHKLRE